MNHVRRNEVAFWASALPAAVATGVAGCLFGYAALVVAGVLLSLTVAALMFTVNARAGGTSFFRDAKVGLVAELVVLPLVVSVKPGSSAQLGVLALLMLSAWVRTKPGSNERRNYATVPAALLVACIILTFRDSPREAAMSLAVAVILWLKSMNTTPEKAYASLLAGMSLYLVANVAGWLAGIQAPGSASRIGGYETSSGLFSARVLFPFSTSINASSCIGAALIVAVAAMIRIHQKPRWYHLVGVASAAVVIVGSNSRGPLILAAVVVTALLLFPRFTRFAGPWIVLVALLLPFLIRNVAPSVLRWIGDLVAGNAYLARGGDANDIMSFGGRDRIWSATINFWSNHVTGLVDELFGFGAPGQVTSGAYGFFPVDISHFLNDRSILTTHNSILQAMLETGLVGAGILLAVAFMLVRRYARTPIYGVALIVGLSGVVEVSLTAGSGHTPFYVLLYLAFFMPRRTPSAGAQLRQQDETSVQRRTGHRSRGDRAGQIR